LRLTALFIPPQLALPAMPRICLLFPINHLSSQVYCRLFPEPGSFTMVESRMGLSPLSLMGSLSGGRMRRLITGIMLPGGFFYCSNQDGIAEIFTALSQAPINIIKIKQMFISNHFRKNTGFPPLNDLSPDNFIHSVICPDLSSLRSSRFLRLIARRVEYSSDSSRNLSPKPPLFSYVLFYPTLSGRRKADGSGSDPGHQT